MIGKPKEQWEIELDALMSEFIKATTIGEEKSLIELTHIKNFIQKEKLLSKIKENKQWAEYFRSPEITEPEIAKVFDAMNIKYGSILERF